MVCAALVNRLHHVHQSMLHAAEAGASMSSASKGNEREIFVSRFLRAVLPPVYRVASGDAVDAFGGQSGQLDVAIESQFFMSFPAAAESDVRCFPVESLLAVIEVKSDLTKQWPEACGSARKVKALRASAHGGGMRFSSQIAEPRGVPVIVVGFRGWTSEETARMHLEASEADAVVCLGSSYTVTRGGLVATGNRTLPTLFAYLQELVLQQGILSRTLMPYVTGS